MFPDTVAVPRATVGESATFATAERLLMHFGTGDVTGLTNLFAPSVEWFGPAPALAGTYSKRELEALVLTCYAAVMPTGLTVRGLIVDGDQAVATGRVRCLRLSSGDRCVLDFAATISVKDGLMQTGWLLTGPAEPGGPDR